MADLLNDAPVELKFDGVRYGYWQKVDIKTSVDDLCASMQLGFTRPGQGDSLGLTANTVAEVLIGGVLVTTVRPDIVRRKVDAESHDLSIDARSLGRELVDCQYSKTLSGLKLGEIVKRICEVFKVPVQIDCETAAVPKFSMQSEVPANALINAVRTANKLLYPLPDGGLILTEPNDEPPIATLVYGVHIKKYEVIDEYKLRFSDYVVKSFDYGGDRALKGAIKDKGIEYFRPMHIVADRMGGSLGSNERRAELERNRRLARAHRIELEVVGWLYEDANGQPQPWPVNRQVRVIIIDEETGEDIDAVYLIGERAFRHDKQGGKIACLQVMHREAFLGEEQKKQKRGAHGQGKKKARAKDE